MTSPDQNYTSWHVGMKVVCIDASRTNTNNEPELENGRVYVIRWIGQSGLSGNICVRLQGVVRVPIGEVDRILFSVCGGEMGFRATRFRPVQTRKTDISIFTAMLSPKPAKAKKVRA